MKRRVAMTANRLSRTYLTATIAISISAKPAGHYRQLIERNDVHSADADLATSKQT
jgi:hypothetical protein